MDKRLCEYSIAENQQQKYLFVIDATSELRDMHIRFFLKRNACLMLEMVVLHTDASIVIDCIIQEGADVQIVGAYVGSSSHKIAITTFQHHQDKNTSSKLIMKGVLYDGAQAHYHGTIRVDKKACGAIASQENKNMLLSDNARAVSVPNLEVLTNDVKCFHGSAIGRFDDEQLFYLASRGIDGKTGQKLLLDAFFEDLFTSEDLNNRLRNEFI